MANHAKAGPEQDRFLVFPPVRQGVEAIFASSGRQFDRHTHDAYALGYIRRGAQRWHSGRGQMDGHAGDLIMSNPGEVHDGSPLHEPQRTWCMIHLDPHLVQSLAAQRGLARPGSYEFANPVVSDRVLLRVLRRLFVGVTNARSPPLLLDELQLRLVGRLGQFRPPQDGAKSSRIAPARERLDDDPANVHRLAELAQACELSPWQLLRSFAAETGFTPHAYQVQRRISLAHRLIADGVSLADAAVLAGFADQSHMTRTFRRKYGYSPSAWSQSRTTRGVSRQPRNFVLDRAASSRPD